MAWDGFSRELCYFLGILDIFPGVIQDGNNGNLRRTFILEKCWSKSRGNPRWDGESGFPGKAWEIQQISVVPGRIRKNPGKVPEKSWKKSWKKSREASATLVLLQEENSSLVPLDQEVPGTSWDVFSRNFQAMLEIPDSFPSEEPLSQKTDGANPMGSPGQDGRSRFPGNIPRLWRLW